MEEVIKKIALYLEQAILQNEMSLPNQFSEKIDPFAGVALQNPLRIELESILNQLKSFLIYMPIRSNQDPVKINNLQEIKDLDNYRKTTPDIAKEMQQKIDLRLSHLKHDLRETKEEPTENVFLLSLMYLNAFAKAMGNNYHLNRTNIKQLLVQSFLFAMHFLEVWFDPSLKTMASKMNLDSKELISLEKICFFELLKGKLFSDEEIIQYLPLYQSLLEKVWQEKTSLPVGKNLPNFESNKTKELGRPSFFEPSAKSLASRPSTTTSDPQQSRHATGLPPRYPNKNSK